MRLDPTRWSLWSVLGSLLAVLALGETSCSRRASIDTSSGGDPLSDLPAELRALGDDPDGDGVSTAEEIKRGTDPLVADFPHLHFTFADLEFGLQAETTRIELDDHLTVHTTDLTELTRSDSFLGIAASAYAGYSHQLTLETATLSYSSFSVSSERLKQIQQRAQEHLRKRKEIKIGPEAGFFSAQVTVSSTHPCSLEDFSVNVLVNGRKEWNLPARNDRNFRSLNTGKTGRPDTFRLRFDGLNTQEMLDKVLSKEDVQIAFEVLPGTIKLSEFAQPGRYSEVLTRIQSRCALVEAPLEATQRFLYVSTAVRGGQEIRLPDLLERIPPRKGVRWGQGPEGSFLQEIFGVPGVELLTPEMTKEGKWCVFHKGEELYGEDLRQRLVHPGDDVRLRFLTARDYWGRRDDWRGYVASYRALHDTNRKEHEFWNDLEQYDAMPDKPWNVLAQQNVQEQAAALDKLYQETFFTRPLPPLMVQQFPLARKTKEEFRTWFRGTDLCFPKYTVTLTSARIWWNIDKELKPTITVRCNNTEISSTGFEADSDKKSGRVTFPDKGNSFEWSPFQPVEIRVRVPGLILMGDASFVRFTGFAALTELLSEQPLDQVKGAEPALSRVQMLCELGYDGQRVPVRDFLKHLDALKPRVLPVVPPNLEPGLLAKRFWIEHHPAAYSRSAALFEDLYTQDQNSPERIGRLGLAMVAYFRSLHFGRCAELARQLPEEDTLSAPMAKYLPYGFDVAGLRHLGKVAAEIQVAPRDSRAFRTLTRFLRTWEAQLRLEHLLGEPKLRQDFTTLELLNWHNSLVVRLAEDSKNTAALGPSPLRDFLEPRCKSVGGALHEVAKQLDVSPTK